MEKLKIKDRVFDKVMKVWLKMEEMHMYPHAQLPPRKLEEAGEIAQREKFYMIALDEVDPGHIYTDQNVLFMMFSKEYKTLIRIVSDEFIDLVVALL